MDSNCMLISKRSTSRFTSQFSFGRDNLILKVFFFFSWLSCANYLLSCVFAVRHMYTLTAGLSTFLFHFSSVRTSVTVLLHITIKL